MSTSDLCDILDLCDIIFIQDTPIGQTFRFKRNWCIRTGNSIFEFTKNGTKNIESIGDYMNFTVAVPLPAPAPPPESTDSKKQEEWDRFDDPY